MEIKVGTEQIKNSLPKIKTSTNTIPTLQCLKEIVKEYIEFKKLKEEEKTKRDKIKRATEVEIKKLKGLKEILTILIESDRKNREKAIDTLLQILEKTNDPQLVQILTQGLVDILNRNSLKGEISTTIKDFWEGESIEI